MPRIGVRSAPDRDSRLRAHCLVHVEDRSVSAYGWWIPIALSAVLVGLGYMLAVIWRG